MPRSIVFGNQSLLICLDRDYNIRDIYYPHVGLENHLEGHKCRFGLWVEGNFSWLESKKWQKEIKYCKETLVGQSVFKNPEISTLLTVKDCVHQSRNIFLREIEITNTSDTKKNYRLFLSHDLQISGTNIGITAYYDPDTDTVIHYLKDRWFLFNGYGNTKNLDGFATGKAHFGDSLGTYKDAEDGELSGNPIDQGTVDSTIQINVSVDANSKSKAYYWFTVGNHYKEVKKLHDFVQEFGVARAIQETIAYDRAWVNKENLKFFDLPDKVVDLYKQSALIVKSQMDRGGAIIAANDSDILQFNRDHYSYLWPRDGALVALALSKAGYSFLTRKFYSLCEELTTPRGFLLHKYNPDGSIGSSWHPWYQEFEGLTLAIQEDETALVIYTLWEYYVESGDMDILSDLYSSLIIPAADFMVDFRDKRGLPLPSYDLWEERRGVHAFTVASVIAGLKAASNFASLFGNTEKSDKYSKVAIKMKNSMEKYLFDKELNRFLRMIQFNKDQELIKDETIDASLFAIFEFEVFSVDNPMVESTMSQIENKLWVKTEVGGLARYENDYYHRISNDIENIPGNPWYICTLWLAEWYIHKAKKAEDKSQKQKKYLNKGKELLEWVANRSLDSLILAEQVNPYNNDPISVSPLTWSHATVILTVLEYLDAYSVMKTCKNCGQPLHYEDKKKIMRDLN